MRPINGDSRIQFTETTMDAQGRSFSCLNVLKKSVADFSYHITRPFHYIGSKSISIPELVIRIVRFIKKWLCDERQDSFFKEIFKTGYSFSAKKLNAEECATPIKFARLYAAVHKDDSTWLPQGCALVKTVIQNGVKMSLFEENDIIYVVFGAKGAAGNKLSERSNIWDSVKNIFGFFPKIYQTAERLYLDQELTGIFEGKRVIFSGQCLGGSLASYVALRHEKEAYCLNSLGLGVGAQWEIGRDKLNMAKKHITLVSVEGDFLSALPRPITWLDFIINFLGLRTIANFGESYVIPHPKEYNWNIDKIHCLILGSLIYYKYPNAGIHTDPVAIQACLAAID